MTFGLEWYGGVVLLMLMSLAVAYWCDRPLREARRAEREHEHDLPFPEGCGAARFTWGDDHTCICRYPYCDGDNHLCLCGTGWSGHPEHEKEFD